MKVMQSVRPKVGDIVMVDVGVFTASRWRGRGYVECEVLEDASEGQVYITPLPPCKSSPMYVALRDISGVPAAEGRE